MKLRVGRKVVDLQYVTCAARSYLERMGTPSSPIELEKDHVRAGYFIASTGRLEPLIFERGTDRYEIGNW
jgi:LysR family transcriptional regulator, regulator for bpeEF and oprC